MGDFREFYLDDDKCPECGWPAVYELPDGSWNCKCTYEFEMEYQRDHAEIKMSDASSSIRTEGDNNGKNSST
jgi:ribosomal protein L37AE/L43A